MTDRLVTRRCPVWVVFNVARSLIRPVATVRGFVTEELSPNADDGGLLPAGELPGVAQLLRDAHPGHRLPCLGFPVAVVDELAPVATLLLHVKGETRRTPDGLQTRVCALDNVPAVGLPRLQPEELLVELVRAKCRRVVFQFFLAQHTWGEARLCLCIFF